MAEQPSEGQVEKRAPTSTQPPAQQSQASASPRADAAPEDPDRGGTAYWRERAGRLGTTPHHIVGALAPFPPDATFGEDDVREFVRQFSNRDEERSE